MQGIKQEVIKLSHLKTMGGNLPSVASPVGKLQITQNNIDLFVLLYFSVSVSYCIFFLFVAAESFPRAFVRVTHVEMRLMPA